MIPTYILDTVDSTNTWAKAHVSLAPFCVIAREQTAGRGRYGNSWFSPPGENLYLTWTEPLRLSLTTYIYPASLAVQALLRSYSIEAQIKWPNDICVKDKKIAGILVEGASNHALIGIGLNVNLDNLQTIDKPATSMKLLLKKDFDLEKIQKALHIELKKWFDRAQEFPMETFAQWRKENSWLLNTEIIVQSSKGYILGTVQEIKDDGSLALLQSSGSILQVSQGIIEGTTTSSS